jgi:hypothetical protein
MANRSFNRRQSLEKEVKDLYIKISIGASGAPTLASRASYGAASIVRNSAGDYTLTLQDKYSSLKFMEAILLDPDAEDIRFQLKSETVNTDKKVNFFTLTGASATDPSNGSAILLKLELKNTSAV